MRAVRKNGEVLGNSWMVGTKWAVSESFWNNPATFNLYIRTRRKRKPFFDNPFRDMEMLRIFQIHRVLCL